MRNRRINDKKERINHGKTDFDFAIEQLEKFWETNEPYARARLLNRFQSAVAEEYLPANAYLASVLVCLKSENTTDPRKVEVRQEQLKTAYLLLTQACEMSDKNANYILAFCLLHTTKYAGPEYTLKSTDSRLTKMANKMLSHKDFFTFLRNIYDNPLERLPIVKGLLEVCGKNFPEADALWQTIETAEQQKLEKLKILSVPKNEPTPEKEIPVEIMSPFNLLKLICQVADGKAEETEAVSQLIKSNIICLRQIPRSTEVWELICRGFTGGKGEVFFDTLQKYGAFDILFPSLYRVSPEQHQNNKDWLKSHLKFIAEKSPPTLLSRISVLQNYEYYKKVAVFLVVKELEANQTKRVHQDFETPSTATLDSVKWIQQSYKIPFHLDDDFMFQVNCLKKLKEQWMANKAKENIQGLAPHCRIVRY